MHFDMVLCKWFGDFDKGGTNCLQNITSNQCFVFCSFNLAISIIQVIAQSINISSIFNEWQSTDNFYFTAKPSNINGFTSRLRCVKSDCNSSCLIHACWPHHICTQPTINVKQTNFAAWFLCLLLLLLLLVSQFHIGDLKKKKLGSVFSTWTIVLVRQRCWPVFH